MKRRNDHPNERHVWHGMKQRCRPDRAAQNPLYAGRGIRVCERWRKSFDAFLADVGPRPSRAHSLDRINNDGDYEPGNVRWATRYQQAENRRISVKKIDVLGAIAAYIEEHGFPPSIRDLSSALNCSYRAIQNGVLTLRKRGLVRAANHCKRTLVPTPNVSPCASCGWATTFAYTCLGCKASGCSRCCRCSCAPLAETEAA